MSAGTGLLLLLAAVAVIVAVRWIAEHTGLPAAALLGARLPDEGLRILERELDHEEGLLPTRRG